MDLINVLWTWGWSLAGYLVPFVFVLTIIVFFHELGHFLVARLCGVRVTAFSIGFGPELAGFNDRHGTRWKVCAIPLGGFVKFLGDGGVASTGVEEPSPAITAAEQRATFQGATVGRRIAIVAAGPISNFVLAIVIFAGIVMVDGKEIAVPRLDAIEAGSPGAAAGFQPGDVIVAVDGSAIGNFEDFQRIVSNSSGRILKVTIDRGGHRMTLDAAPALREMSDGLGGVRRVGYLGVRRSSASPDVKVEKFGPMAAIYSGAGQTWYIAEQTLRFIFKLAARGEPADQLGGPIKIAQISGKIAATFGLGALMQLAGILSVSVGLLNLFPIPALDGGHLLFYSIEASRGRPISARAQKWSLLFGGVAILALMIFTTVIDVLRLFT